MSEFDAVMAKVSVPLKSFNQAAQSYRDALKGGKSDSNLRETFWRSAKELETLIGEVKSTEPVCVGQPAPAAPTSLGPISGRLHQVKAEISKLEDNVCGNAPIRNNLASQFA